MKSTDNKPDALHKLVAGSTKLDIEGFTEFGEGIVCYIDKGRFSPGTYLWIDGKRWKPLGKDWIKKTGNKYVCLVGPGMLSMDGVKSCVAPKLPEAKFYRKEKNFVFKLALVQKGAERVWADLFNPFHG